MKKTLFILGLGLILPITLFSCVGPESSTNPITSTTPPTSESSSTSESSTNSQTSTPDIIHVESVNILNSETSLNIGDTLQLNTEVLPENAENKTVTYSSSDEEIASISATGLITAKKAGSVTITVTSNDGNKQDSITIKVNEAQVKDYYFEGEDAVLTNGSMGAITINTNDPNARNNSSLGNVNLNEGATLSFTVVCKEALTAEAFVSLALGSPTVADAFTATLNNQPVEIQNSFTATGPTDWTHFEEFSLGNLDFNEGINTFVLTITGPVGNFDYIKLATSGEISEQKVVQKLSLQTEQELLKVGDTVSLSHSTTPSSLNDTEIVYTSSDPSLVSVEGNTITAKKEGIVTITGTAQDEGKCQGSITIFVSDKTGTNYEAEQAKLENCNIESANNNYVGGFNNEGAKVTFTVSAPSNGDYLMRIYTSIVIAGNNNFNDYFNMYVNDAKLDSTKGTFAAKGEPGWNTDTGYYTIQVTLNEGENTIILEAASTQTKTTLDKIVIY